jgi:hypothetical protein
MNDTLKKLLEREQGDKLDYIKQAIRAEILAEFLPPEIQELNIVRCDVNYNDKILEVAVRGKGALELIKGLGAIGFRPKYISWDKSWNYFGGKLQLFGDYQANFSVYDTDKPLNCRIETREKTVIEEVAICGETGEEL